jgi:exopolyphosphatase/guanosine-5'-triphosphate,3'-diphosphate pyrophosphatase
MRFATIDVGTNSVLLLIVESTDDGLRAVYEEAVVTRLGQGVDAHQRLAEQAVARTLSCLSRYAAQIEAHGAAQRAAVATSVLRDAADGDGFLDRAASILGTRPEIISGDEEAALTFRGALTGLSLPDGAVGVGDIGGGSTELIRGTVAPATIHQAASVDIGCVRLTERLLAHDPPTADEITSLRWVARNALADAPALRGSPLGGVGGTLTTLAALILQVVPYQGERVHGQRLSEAQLAAALASLSELPLARRRELAGLDPARADVIVAGAVIAQELLRHAQATEIIVSDRGVRWGLALTMA